MPFMSIVFIPPCFRAGFLLRAVGFAFDFGLRLDLRAMFMPGMLPMSCCARTGMAAMKTKQMITSAQKSLPRNLNLKLLELYMIPSRTGPLSKPH